MKVRNSIKIYIPAIFENRVEGKQLREYIIFLLTYHHGLIQFWSFLPFFRGGSSFWKVIFNLWWSYWSINRKILNINATGICSHSRFLIVYILRHFAEMAILLSRRQSLLWRALSFLLVISSFILILRSSFESRSSSTERSDLVDDQVSVTLEQEQQSCSKVPVDEARLLFLEKNFKTQKEKSLEDQKKKGKSRMYW